MSRDSSIGIATDYGEGWTVPMAYAAPVQLVPGVKRPGRGVEPPHLAPRLMKV